MVPIVLCVKLILISAASTGARGVMLVRLSSIHEPLTNKICCTGKEVYYTDEGEQTLTTFGQQIRHIWQIRQTNSLIRLGIPLDTMRTAKAIYALITSLKKTLCR